VSVSARGETEMQPLAAGSTPVSTVAPGRLRDQEAWPWFALFALALALVEWATFHRRLTV
jgi:hypothetical protein